jgi:hypothetical protein
VQPITGSKAVGCPHNRYKPRVVTQFEFYALPKFFACSMSAFRAASNRPYSGALTVMKAIDDYYRLILYFIDIKLYRTAKAMIMFKAE